MQTAIATLVAFLIAGCAAKSEIPVNPSVSAPTRVMLKENVNVYLKGVSSGTAFTVDFGDGTTVEAVTPEPAVHRYTEGADYQIRLTSSAIEDYSKRLRCYPLEALSSAQQNFRILPIRKFG